MAELVIYPTGAGSSDWFSHLECRGRRQAPLSTEATTAFPDPQELVRTVVLRLQPHRVSHPSLANGDLLLPFCAHAAE
jgi:hypothetical protein